MTLDSILKVLSFDLLLKALAILAGIVGAAYQIRQFATLSRSSIKIDLEILKMLDKSDESYEIVKNRVDLLIKRVYAKKKEGFIVYDSRRFAFGIISFLVSLPLSFRLNSNGLTMFGSAAILYMILSIGSVLQSLDPKAERPN